MLSSLLLIELLASCAASRQRLREQIVRHQKDFAEYQSALKDLENKNPVAVDLDALNQAAVMGDALQGLGREIFAQEHLRNSLGEKLDRVLPWVVTDMIRRGNKVRIPRGEGEGSYLIWLNDGHPTEYMVEGLAYGEDPDKVLTDPIRHKTVAELIEERYGPKAL
jgi:hypothetical protein